MSIDTGRVTQALPVRLRRMLFAQTAAESRADLRILARIDRAHVLMLVETGLMPAQDASQILRAIQRCCLYNFTDFATLEPVRGLYLLWEQQLIRATGEEVAGNIHLGRSRNDLMATLQRIKLRKSLVQLLKDLVKLHALLVRLAKQFAVNKTSGYTHYQPAQPLTLGHQYAAMATSLGRDIQGLLDVHAFLLDCPLGAGALAGTSWAIDTKFTARLLGFERSCTNSLDAVASRDVFLRILSACAVLAVSLSRIATDLLLWNSEEFGFIELPDHLVGTSSQMPQKRNPFLLEHVQSRGMSALGALVTAASRSHGTPFSNSVAAGTESVRPVWEALQDVRQAVVILQHIMEGLRPNVHRMAMAANNPVLLATAFAEVLTREEGIPFRRAHQLVGQAVSNSVSQRIPLREAVEQCQFDDPCRVSLSFSAEEVIASANYGGGPGYSSVASQVESLQGEQARFRSAYADMTRRERASRQELKHRCQELMGMPLSM